jgi:MFS transporter, MHS family, citrate/tricarballylate:H+ symporter
MWVSDSKERQMNDSDVVSPELVPVDEVKGEKKSASIKPILQVVAGNALEIYDFMIYGYYAKYIAQTFFPSDTEHVSLMLTLTTFAFGFLARPVGAIVIGAYTDRHGRRKGLILALSLMSLGIISIACTPSYAQIGIAAPIIVVCGRLLQGFSAGAELGGVVVYLAEIAPPGKRAFYTCWQAGSQQLSVMAASLAGFALLHLLAPEALHAWGWRIPLLLGCAVIPVMFWLRSSLQETSVFARKKTTPSISEICSGLVEGWRTIVLCMGMVAMATVTATTITTYAPTFIHSLKLGESAGFVTLFFGGLSVLCWLPIMASVADRVNRRTMLIVVASLAILTAYPLLTWLASGPSVLRFAIVELWFSFIYASYSAVQVATMVELVPPQARTAGYAFAQAVAAAVLGGFTPVILVWLTNLFQNNAMVGVWLAINAAISLIAALVLDKKATARRQAAELS